MRNCETCSLSNNAELNEKTCIHAIEGSCHPYWGFDFDTWLEMQPEAVVQGHSFDED